MSTSKSYGTYINPIISGSNPDPSICCVNNDYFLITSSFDFFPGIPIYHSTDLISWTLISHVLTRKSQLDIRAVEVGGGVWAPTIRYRSEQQERNELGTGGTFYVCGGTFDKYRPQADERVWPRGWYTKCREKDIWDENGDGWSELIYFDMLGFDQDLFWDDDGQVYLSSTYRMLERTAVPPGSKPLKDFAIHICKVDLKSGRCLSRPELIRSSSSGVAEGSHIVKRGKYYYLFTAEGGTEGGHSEFVSRSDVGPFGPWEVKGKVISSGTGPEDEVQNTGHCDVVEDANGNWWAVLLAVRPVKTADGSWERSVFGRETFLISMTWQDDWLVFNNNQRVPLLGQSQHLYNLPHQPEWRDDFTDASKMQLGWYRKSTPQKLDWSLTERPGFLRLWGSPYTLSSPMGATMWLRKQTSRNMTFRTKLDFKPNSSRVEAGVVVWWNYTCYSSMGFRLRDDEKQGERVVRLSLADGSVVEQALKSMAAEVTLSVTCGNKYSFAYQELGTGDDMQELGSISNAVMTRDPEVGAPFTGMMIGVYAFGEMEAVLAPADFEYVEID